MSKREEQKATTRKKIIDVAYNAYARDGFSVSTAQIAKQANVSHGTLFAHFATSQQLMSSVIDEFQKVLGIRLHLISGYTNMEEFLSIHLDVLEEYEDFYSRLISEMNLLPYEIRLSHVSMQSIVSHHMQVVVTSNMNVYRLSEIEPYMLFNTWIALVHYYIQNNDIFEPGGSVLKGRRKEMIDTFLTLISK